MTRTLLLRYGSIFYACALLLWIVPEGFGQSEESGDMLLLDLGIVIESSDSTATGSRKNDESLNISSMPGGAAYVQSTRELRSVLDELRSQIAQLESSLDGNVDEVRLENQRLRELLSKLQEEDVVPVDQSDEIVADLKKREVPVESPQELYQVPTDWHEVMKAYRAGDYPAVVVLCDALPEAVPDHEQPDQVAYWCGDAYFSVGQLERALQILESITTEDSPVQDDAIILTGLILMQQGRANEARDHFQRIIDYYPESDYHRLAGLTLKELKE
ncbi:tetratricopeptide repeat protein [Candidatus Neomarinimicrobiota bacterium]